MTVGSAGHIDPGKTTLVPAPTGGSQSLRMGSTPIPSATFFQVSI